MEQESNLINELPQSALEKVEKQISSILPVKAKEVTTSLHIKKDPTKTEKKSSRTKVKIRPSDNLGAAPLPEGYISSLMAKQQAEPKIIAPTSHAEKVRIAQEKRPYIPKPQKKSAQNILRAAGGEVWEDPTLVYWDDSTIWLTIDDYRLFAGDLGNEVTDELLAKAFSNYPSVLRTYVVRDKKSLKSKGYGFISFGDPDDYVRAMKEMNGKYVGNRPITLKRSNWKDRQADATNVARQKELAEVAKNPIKKY